MAHIIEQNCSTLLKGRDAEFLSFLLDQLHIGLALEICYEFAWFEILNVWWRHATLFDLLCFLYMVHAGIDVIHYCSMDVVGWKRQEEGLKLVCMLSVGLCWL
jgi:hypothetical protein